MPSWKTALAALTLAAAPAIAQADERWGALASAVTLTSDFRYQGVSRSDAQPALQGYVHWWRPDNFYAGVFATQVDFNDPGGTSYELDVYAGRHFDLNEKKTRLTVEAMRTMFPDNDTPGPTYDFWQAKLAARHTLGGLSLGATTTWTPEASYGAGTAQRLEGDVAWAATPWLTVGGGLGRQWIERGVDRSYWNLGAKAAWKSLAFDLRYFDNDLSPAECGYLSPDACEGALVGAITWELPLIY